MTGTDLSTTPLPADAVGVIEGISSTRAIRRYLDEPIPDEVLRAIMFAATRAPSGSNRQTFRMMVLTDGPKARQAKRMIGDAARAAWGTKRETDSYDSGSGAVDNSPKARMARTMQSYVDNLEKAPVLVLPCLIRYREATSFEGASVYPAMQNMLLAARSLGYGGVVTGWHYSCETELRTLLSVPDDVFMAATVTMGKPVGKHGPVRRRPIGELIYEDEWGHSAPWAIDPPGTTFTSAGPPKKS